MGNISILQYPNDKQFTITVPNALVLALGWKKGDRIEFFLTEDGTIQLRKIEEER